MLFKSFPSIDIIFITLQFLGLHHFSKEMAWSSELLQHSSKDKIAMNDLLWLKVIQNIKIASFVSCYQPIMLIIRLHNITSGLVTKWYLKPDEASSTYQHKADFVTQPSCCQQILVYHRLMAEQKLSLTETSPLTERSNITTFRECF